MAFFMGDRLFRFDERAPEGEIPDLGRAARELRSAQRSALVRSREDEDAAPWSAWKGRAEWADRAAFGDALDFLVNVPSLAGEMAGVDPGSGWYWEKIPPQKVKDCFPDERVQGLLAAAAPSEAEILGGWVLAKEYGRVDEDVTFSDFTWLFATSEAVVHLRQYKETLH